MGQRPEERVRGMILQDEYVFFLQNRSRIQSIASPATFVALVFALASIGLLIKTHIFRFGADGRVGLLGVFYITSPDAATSWR